MINNLSNFINSLSTIHSLFSWQDVMDIKYSSNNTCLHKLTEKRQHEKVSLRSWYLTCRAISDVLPATLSYNSQKTDNVACGTPIAPITLNISFKLISRPWTKGGIQWTLVLLLSQGNFCWHSILTSLFCASRTSRFSSSRLRLIRSRLLFSIIGLDHWKIEQIDLNVNL